MFGLSYQLFLREMADRSPSSVHAYYTTLLKAYSVSFRGDLHVQNNIVVLLVAFSVCELGAL